MEPLKRKISRIIKNKALELGFSDCGFAPAVRLNADAERLRKWLDEGLHAGMGYMENHFEERVDPEKLLSGTKSVIIVLMNYFTEEEIFSENDNFIISKYAYGNDYHFVLKEKLNMLFTFIKSNVSSLEGRIFVDSAPVLERSLAALAGLGWIGKNTNLISPKYGSFIFLGEILVNIELDYGTQLPDYCGGCTKCIQACPTGAIVDSRKIDSNKCISYLTIENKGDISNEFTGKLKNRIFGCDICQDVCPWNRKSEINTVDNFQPKPDLVGMTKSDWQKLTKEKFLTLFKNSAVKRAGYKGLKRNVDFVSQNQAG
ncbi:MAG: tRNA epoxyqueuosine(34) reductase QueG [Bacteroidales bacterium]|nr:tRNA epoxyqueuosine(34) reductase QueG [Bacteroidales bacterium]